MRIAQTAALALAFLAFAATWNPGARPAGAEEPTFSGKTEVYKDTYNGFQMDIPVEFKLQNKGATTDFLGPMVTNFATTIYINTVEMPGVPSKTLYTANVDAKKKDRNYTDIKPVKVKSGVKGDVYAFSFSEASHAPGSPDEKKPDDHHRWHLLVFGNGRFYTLGFTGSYQAFKEKRLQATYDQVIKSFTLIPTK